MGTLTHSEPYHLVSRPWAKAIHDHAYQVDGIVYSAKHDEQQLAVAHFDRAAAKIRLGAKHRLSRTDHLTLRLLDHYGLALEE